MNSSRRGWLLGILIVVVLVVVVFVFFAMLGPSIGNVFSNIVSNFDSDTPPRLTQPPANVEPTDLANPTIVLDDVTARPTQPPPTTAADEPTEIVAVATQAEADATDTDTPEPTPTTILGGNDTATEDEPDIVQTAQALDQTPTLAAVASHGTDVPFATPEADREVNLIGNGSAYVFHDNNVTQDENTLVELRVFFDEFYITATPTSAITAIPAPEQVRPDVDTSATQTPRAARFSDDGIELPEQLMAWLDCDDQFDNCGSGGILPMRIQSPNSWRWSIKPKDGVQGIQNLRVELWTVDSNGERDQRIWTHDFQMGVDVDFLAQNNNLVIVALIGLIILMLIVFGGMRWRDHREANRQRPKVFISYRRLVSAGFGRALHDSLVAAGADVFIDIDDIHAGSFSDYIKDNIRERDYFLVLLAPKTLESTWVIQEILYALEHNRTIIPVLLNEFDLYGDEMPDNLTFLQQQNAVTLPVEHFESGVNRIKTFIGLK